MNPQYSIIIPHYDIPDLLMRCLASIPVREEIQVVVVDDNSPGADLYKDKYPALSRPHLEFIQTTKGGGAGYARNIGLEHAKGEWLLFADADDYFVDNMYELLLSRSNSEADIVFFRKKSVLLENPSCESGENEYLNKITDTFLRTGDEWPLRTSYYAPWGKMIRRDLVIRHNIRFDEVRYSNDCFFSVCAGVYASKIAVEDQVLYIKTARPGSLTAGFCIKPDELSIRTDVAFRVDKFLYSHGACRGRLFKQYFWRCFRSERSLLRKYFGRLDEIYPTKRLALQDLRKGHSIKVQLAMYFYAILHAQS